MSKGLILLVLTLGLSHTISSTSVICYHGTWSQYRSGNGHFAVTEVPASLCTHYIYAFVGLDATTSEVVTLDSWLDFGLGAIASAVGLKSQNPDLKVIVAIGGWNEGSAKYSAMAADPSRRAIFVASALNFVETYGFDGFDLDWEYPARRDSANAADKENFAALIKELYEVFNPKGLLLSAAVSATPDFVDRSYDVPALSQYLDFINVMLYDFHGSWDTAAYHNAPLYSTAKLAGTEYADYSVNASIQGWLARGASPSKLALGVPFYGHTMTLASSTATSPGSSITTVQVAGGPYTATEGFWGYNEIVEKFNAGGWTLGWDDEQQVPYAYSGTTWLSYDNEESIALKVAYAKDLGLGAVMLWSLETEDFLGLSGTQYPLLNAIANALGNSGAPAPIVEDVVSASSSSTTASSTTSTTSTTTSTTSTTTTAPEAADSEGSPAIPDVSADPSRIPDANSCVATGYFGSSVDCNIYFYCQKVNEAYVGSTFTCVAGLNYDSSLGVCNYPELVTSC